MKRKEYISLSLLFIFSTLLTLLTGEMSLQELFHSFYLRVFEKTLNWTPLLDERIPRALVLACTGASLALAGAVMQSLFHNPLASPGYLGVSSGGSLFVFFVLIAGLHNEYPVMIPVAAVFGSLFTLLAVWNLSKRNGTVLLYQLILTGIAISTLLLALQNTLIYYFRYDWQLLQLVTEWQAGSTFNRNWQHVHLQLPLTIVGLITCFCYRQEMNILSLGEEEAKNIGVDVGRVRWHLFLAVALLSGGALAGVGVVAFFGLILPHIIRNFIGPNHQKLIPYSIGLGASVLMLLDFLLRFFDMHFMTIGNITALLGGVFFFLLLLPKRPKNFWLKKSYADS